MSLYSPDIADPVLPVPSYWQASAAPLGRPLTPFGGRRDRDVVVIGAGYTGLMAAYHLAFEYGVDVTVLEAGEPGAGASGRNGGFCCLGGAKLSYQKMIRRFGLEETKRFFAVQREAVDFVRDFTQRLDIEVDASGEGELLLAHRPGRMAELESEAAFLKETFGLKTEMLSFEELAERGCHSPVFHGGLALPTGFGLHPLKYLRGLAERVLAAGVPIHGGAPVLGWRREAGRTILETPLGELRARRVVLAMNGYAQEDLFLPLAGRLLPALSSVLVTRPLSDAELETQGWTSLDMAADTRALLHYFRLLPDGRFLFGGRGGTRGGEKATGRYDRKLEEAFNETFPIWSNVEIEFRWRGLVCLTRSLLPFVGPLDAKGRLWTACGYHGNGVSFASWSGRALAAMMQGDAKVAAKIPGMLRRGLKRFPFPGLRQSYLEAAYLHYGWKDRR